MDPNEYHRLVEQNLTDAITKFLENEAGTLGGREAQMEVTQVTPLQIQVKVYQPGGGPHYFFVKVSRV